jgi:hypothetical protein
MALPDRSGEGQKLGFGLRGERDGNMNIVPEALGRKKRTDGFQHF